MGNETFDIALGKALQAFGLNKLKEEQEDCIRKIICKRQDVLAVLPTGYGKSAIYQLLPLVGRELGKKFMVVVVSPLEYIRKQQVKTLKLRGVKAGALGTEDDEEIRAGKCSIIYGSAEQWLSSEWKQSLQFGSLHQANVLVVDEVHTVETWGIGTKGKAAFRAAFSRVTELRSLLQNSTPVLGLTATANKEMRKRLAKYLGVKTPPVVVSPNKVNIRFSVIKAEVGKNLECLDWLLEMVTSHKEEMPRTIIFCRTVSDIVKLLTYFLMKLGQCAYIDCNGEATHKHCLLGVYYSQTPKSHKDSVTSSFEGVTGKVRVVLASTSLSMGVDFPNVRYVIHYGPSRSLTSHLQEAGRAGRDGQQANHITVFHGRQLVACDKDIKTAIKQSINSCVRVAYLQMFDDNACPQEPKHDCCSQCHQSCQCNEDSPGCSKVTPVFEMPTTGSQLPSSTIRDVSEEELNCLTAALKQVQLSLSSQLTLTLFDSSGVMGHGLSDTVIDSIGSNAVSLFNVFDIMEFCNIPSLKLAVIILEVLNEIFEDVVIPDEIYTLLDSKDSFGLLHNFISTVTEPDISDWQDYCLSDDSDIDDLLL